MERVTGIGGFFFRARDADALRRWYADNLGVDLTPTSYDERPWWQEAGPTVFEAFEEKADFFGTEKPWVMNFRVRDLDAIAEQLRAAGADVEIDPQDYPNGRFASTADPEGNPIQLWEPTADELARSTASETQG
jgi:predicted enzyme related to lactoylglutathione lyase